MGPLPILLRRITGTITHKSFSIFRATQGGTVAVRLASRTSGNTNQGGTMTRKADKKVWFITGAGRGMGVDFVKAALAAGHAVVGTGRDPDALAKAVGESDDLLVVKLDVTSRTDAEAAVRAAVNRFGRIDVLVNNAGNFFAGYFEELTPEQIDRQLGTLLIGPMNVTRAVLPVMRKQRSGHVISISSTAEQKVADLQAQMAAHRDLSTSLALAAARQARDG